MTALPAERRCDCGREVDYCRFCLGNHRAIGILLGLVVELGQRLESLEANLMEAAAV